ncbi:MAG TPA: DUF2905 domain-containing protein [Pyrinomonadaceae bacterium]|jgi:uncharacterized membrane protein YidH (DUF202 family)|nr:DUF2905 domain-containing protein [Pyrinomonadaceae bacterium]
MNRTAGMLMVVGGICLILVGLLAFSGALNWFGRLPGDIRYQGENTRVYFPLVSMLIISLVVSLLLFVIRKLL